MPYGHDLASAAHQDEEVAIGALQCSSAEAPGVRKPQIAPAQDAHVMNKITPEGITPEHVVAALETAYKAGPASNDRKTWTKHLRKSLAEQAGRFSSSAFGHSESGRSPEYLVDHSWARANHATGDTYWLQAGELVLAAEFEWGGSREQAWEDFYKLLDVRARGRLFVGTLWQNEWSKRRDLVEKMAMTLQRHPLNREGEWVVVSLWSKGDDDHGATYVIYKGAREPTVQLVSDTTATSS